MRILIVCLAMLAGCSSTPTGNMNADVRFRSVNGRLNTDFPLSVSGSLGGRKVEGRIGNGGRELVVETVNGNVELKRESI